MSTPVQERNLLDNRAFAAFVRSRWYPGVFQVPVAAVFGFVAYELLTGPTRAHDNAGTALMWVLWWPVVPITFLLLGRFWCAVCPFATLSDLVQRLVGAGNQRVGQQRRQRRGAIAPAIQAGRFGGTNHEG